MLRVYVQCAAIRYGNPDDADLIKLGKLTFLQYSNFDADPAPALRTRIKINLRTQFVQVFDHQSSTDRLLNKERYTR